MENFWEVAVPIIFLFASIGIAIALLTRQRSRVRPEHEDPTTPPIPATASRRQRKVLAQLEPNPEIPTVMDLVRTEIAELGIDQIPSAAGLSEPVVLKVYRRDATEGCDHEGAEFVVAEGVVRADALEDDVTFVCNGCSGTNDEDPAFTE